MHEKLRLKVLFGNSRERERKDRERDYQGASHVDIMKYLGGKGKRGPYLSEGVAITQLCIRTSREKSTHAFPIMSK